MDKTLTFNSVWAGEQEKICMVEKSSPEPVKPMKLADCEVLGSFVEIDILTPEPPCPSLLSVASSPHLPPSNQKSPPNKVSQFPDIEKCIPRWKEIFPWVCWCSEDNSLFCLHCRELLRTSFPDQISKSVVVQLTSSDKIFTVAKTLRSHHISESHTLAIYLYSHSSLISCVSLFLNHYKDMKYEEEVLETIKGLFNYSELNKESFVKMITSIGQFIEKALVKNLKESKYFSVVADQCRGILVLRWVGKAGIVEEHIFWSYLIEWYLTPMQYLKNLGLDLSKMSLYIANSLCQQCSRCQNLSVMPASLPPRPPSVFSFAGILWNLDFLRPLMSLVNTIYKLMKVYPYKFLKKFDKHDMKCLFEFSVKPSCLIKVIDNFDTIKEIAIEIYEKRSCVEALGLAMVDLKNDETHKKILFHLQEIIDVVREAGLGDKISDHQIVKLNQALGSLKMRTFGANFVQYDLPNKKNSDQRSAENIRDFLQFVEMFIDENQKTIYYHGRDKIKSFTSLCSLNAILDGSKEKIDEAKLFVCFNVIYDVYTQVLKNGNATDKMRIFKCIKNFYNHLLQSHQTATSCMDIIQLFYGDKSLQRRFPDAFEMFIFCATMPFQSCQLNRSLFVSFVVEQRIESSIWNKMNANIKPWLLYMQNELSHIPQKDLLTWWVETIE